MSSTAAMALAEEPSPGRFGVELQSLQPTKNEMEKKWTENARVPVLSEQDLLRQRFAGMR